jgi:Transposase
MEGSLETVTGVRRYRTDEEERRMVEGTLSSGESVAVMARHYGVNANQLFRWRKQYQAGLLGTSQLDCTKGEVELDLRLLAKNWTDAGNIALYCLEHEDPHGAIWGNAPWQRWHSWQLWHLVFCKLTPLQRPLMVRSPLAAPSFILII